MEQNGCKIKDEDDIFLCGRCKSQFTVLSAFISHKQNNCSKPSINIASSRQPIQSSSRAQENLSVEPLQFTPVQCDDIPATISSQRYLDTNFERVPETELSQSQPIPPGSSQVFRAVVLISENETLTLDIPLDQLQIPSGGCLIQSAPGCQDPSVLSAPDRELTTLTSLHSSGPDEHGQTHLTSSESIRISPIFQPTTTDTCYYQDQDGRLINLQYLNDGSGCIKLVSGFSEIPMIREMSFTPVQLSESPILSMSPSQGEVEPELNSGIEQTHSIPIDKEQYILSSEISPVIQTNEIPEKRNYEYLPHLKCRYCGKYFSTTSLLENHLLTHSKSKPSHECPLCRRVFKLKSNLRKHFNTHKVWPKTRETLPKSENVELTSNQIQSTVTSIPVSCSYSCQYCSDSFLSYRQLKSHLSFHKTEKVFKCVDINCNETFDQVEKLILHTKTHAYHCHQCSEVLPSLQELRRHERVHQKKSQKFNPKSGRSSTSSNIQCTTCGSKFKTIVALDHHLLSSTHHYPCTHAQCTMVFNTERYLRRHLKLHADSRPFQCNKCDKSFKTEHYLKVHLGTHAEAKAFKCEECGAQFARKDILGRHIGTLHRQRVILVCPFKDICRKVFYRKDKLQDHIWSHSSKVFVCEVAAGCQQSFTSSTLLRHHQNAEHRELFVQTTCSNCDKVFKTKHHLKIHLCKGKSQPSISDITRQKRSEVRGSDASIGQIVLPSNPTFTRTVRKRSKKQNYVIHRLHEGVLEIPLAG